MYNVGDKIDLKDVDLFVEINSVYPGSQGMRLTIEGENYYGAYINGNKCYVGEKLIEMFHEGIAKKKVAIKAAEKPIEKPVEVKEVVEEKPEVKKKKWGRK
jgi:hypothetical protein